VSHRRARAAAVFAAVEPMRSLRADRVSGAAQDGLFDFVSRQQRAMTLERWLAVRTHNFLQFHGVGLAAVAAENPPPAVRRRADGVAAEKRIPLGAR